MKGQSLIVQFILFFVIGLGVLAAIGTIFRLYSDFVREDMSDANRKLLGSYISSAAISMGSNCKECNITAYKIKTSDLVANYILNFYMARDGLLVASEPGGGSTFTSMHNLKESSILLGSAGSTQPMTLTFIGTANKQEFTLASTG